MNVKAEFLQILDIEAKISDIYNHLFELDKNGFKNYQVYSDFIDNLKYYKKEEYNLFKILTSDQISAILDYICYDFDWNIKKENIFSENVMERFLIKIKAFLSGFVYINQFLDDNDLDGLDNSFQDKSMNIILSESIDLLYSFVDEDINKEKDFDLKEKLIWYKYLYTFVMPNFIEDKIIERYFDTDYSLYLNSNALSFAEGINEEFFFKIKNTFAVNSFCKCLDEVINNHYDKYLVKISLANIRSTLLLMDDEVYRPTVKEILLNKNLINKLNLLFNIDFISTINSDRERHKTISLILRK